jgi:hypothetical protein
VLDSLRDARYPPHRLVTREQYDACEQWLYAEQQRRIEEWRAAGSPDDWPDVLGLLWIGPSGGLMLKGVELMPYVDVPAR